MFHTRRNYNEFFEINNDCHIDYCRTYMGGKSDWSSKNAVRSAKQYLSIQGYSRDGLIHQLSSDYGDGYSVADATVAVDSLNIDWNKQAVRSAKQYLSMQGFSCKGLIKHFHRVMETNTP